MEAVVGLKVEENCVWKDLDSETSKRAVVAIDEGDVDADHESDQKEGAWNEYGCLCSGHQVQE